MIGRKLISGRTIYIGLFWCLTLASTSSTSNLRTNSLIYNQNDTIRLTISGNFITSGSCGDEIIYGIVKESQSSWDTLLNVNNRSIMMCGFGYKKFKKEPFDIVIKEDLDGYIPDRYFKFEEGVYKLLFIKSKSNKVVCSNSFKVSS